jgi:hypothetical protein
MLYPRAAGRLAVWCARVAVGVTIAPLLALGLAVGVAVGVAVPSHAAAATSPVPAADVADPPAISSPHLATRMNAELRADIGDADRAIRPYIPLAIEALVLVLVLRQGMRFLRRRYARKWAGVHLLLDLTPFPATDFNLHAVRRGRKRTAANVVRLEIDAIRTTSTTYAEVLG